MIERYGHHHNDHRKVYGTFLDPEAEDEVRLQRAAGWPRKLLYATLNTWITHPGHSLMRANIIARRRFHRWVWGLE